MIGEADTGSSTVTVSTRDVTFATDQEIELSFDGTAVADDYTVSATTLTLVAELPEVDSRRRDGGRRHARVISWSVANVTSPVLTVTVESTAPLSTTDQASPTIDIAGFTVYRGRRCRSSVKPDLRCSAHRCTVEHGGDP